ncbi:MAG: alpha/beta fold hydrolase [Betaproteobacteria bacterium]|nr:alpha/beta fold hydrolase [Betaproteobacteria bacterium]
MNKTPAVLLLHGLWSSPSEMMSVANTLRRTGYRVEIPEISGYTYAAGMPVRPWRDWLQAALAAFDKLAAEHENVSVGGLCIGGMLALAVAAQRPGKVQALSILSPTVFFDGWGLPWLTRLRYIGYYTPFRYFWTVPEQDPFGVKNPLIRRWIAREMAQRNVSVAGAAQLPLIGLHESERLIAFVKRTLAEISAPTLIIHAREDEISTLRSPYYLLERLGSHIKHLRVLEDSYHMVTLDNERQQVAAAINDFFLEQAPLSLASVVPFPSQARVA